jgi:hypothetical protein
MFSIESSSFYAERKAHPPLEAGAEVDRGISVVVTENHGNRAASSGWMMRLVRFGEFIRARPPE